MPAIEFAPKKEKSEAIFFFLRKPFFPATAMLVKLLFTPPASFTLPVLGLSTRSKGSKQQQRGGRCDDTTADHGASSLFEESIQ